jgi:AraC-like DNA-binding protein
MDALAASSNPTPNLVYRRWTRPEGPPRSYPESAHPTYEVGRVSRGGTRYRVGSAVFEAGPGATILVPSEVGHSTTFEGALEAEALQISAAMVTGVARASGLDPSGDPMVVAADDPRAERIGHLFRLIAEETTRNELGSTLAIDALTEALLVEALRFRGARTEETHVDPRIGRAIDLVQSSFADPLTVDDLAQAAAMSRFHFSRCFRAQVGVSPYQYVQRVRVRRGAELLSNGKAVSEAAFDVGFTDLSRFARAFRKEMGCAPHEWPDQGASARCA